MTLSISVGGAEVHSDEGARIEIESRPPTLGEPVEVGLVSACRHGAEVVVVDGTLDIELHPGPRGINLAAIEIETLE